MPNEYIFCCRNQTLSVPMVVLHFCSDSSLLLCSTWTDQFSNIAVVFPQKWKPENFQFPGKFSLAATPPSHCYKQPLTIHLIASLSFYVSLTPAHFSSLPNDDKEVRTM